MSPKTVYFPQGISPQADSGGFCEPLPIVDAFPAGRIASQNIIKGAGEVWRQEVTVITRGVTEQALFRVLMRLRGGVNRLRCPDLFADAEDRLAGYLIPNNNTPLFTDGGQFDDGYGFADPSTSLANNQAAGDTSITLNASFAYTVPVKKRVELNGRLYLVTAYDSGTRTMTIHPPLRDAMSAGDGVWFYKPKTLWKLESATAVKASIGQAGERVRVLKMIEEL